MRDKKIEQWQRDVAASIVKNVVQFYKDYRSQNCIEDVAQEIANATPTRVKEVAEAVQES